MLGLAKAILQDQTKAYLSRQSVNELGSRARLAAKNDWCRSEFGTSRLSLGDGGGLFGFPRLSLKSEDDCFFFFSAGNRSRLISNMGS